LSKTLYLQLINEETRQIFWQEKYEIIKRFADGHVFLQDTLPEGNYLLMAFESQGFTPGETLTLISGCGGRINRY